MVLILVGVPPTRQGYGKDDSLLLYLCLFIWRKREGGERQAERRSEGKRKGEGKRIRKFANPRKWVR